MITLSHFSKAPWIFDKDFVYRPFDFRQHHKPIGLWLSDESDHGWKQWCESENWGDCSHCTDFVCDTTKWCVLKTPEEILEFGRNFRLPCAASPFISVDWPHVQKEFSGILISPYQWSVRLNHDVHWYYGWDCASGCVWDLSTISVKGTP